jgi:hypothetical protein
MEQRGAKMVQPPGRAAQQRPYDGIGGCVPRHPVQEFLDDSSSSSFLFNRNARTDFAKVEGYAMELCCVLTHEKAPI